MLPVSEIITQEDRHDSGLYPKHPLVLVIRRLFFKMLSQCQVLLSIDIECLPSFCR